MEEDGCEEFFHDVLCIKKGMDVKMVELKKEEVRLIEMFFTYTDETMVLSFIQGHMGRGWTDNLSNPTCAKILVGDFCFLAGDHEAAEASSLVKNIPDEFKSPWLLIIPQNKAWGDIIEACYEGRFSKYSRYAIKKEKDCFCKEKLLTFIDCLPEKYQLKRIDKTLYRQTQSIHFARDFCSQFDSADDYAKRGLGYCVLYNDEIVCGASSYTVYDEGIEIEIGTKEEYRRQGLATLCAAKLILECMKRGLYPSWDAANKESVALSEKLGYHFNYEYDTYEIDCKKH